MPRAPRRPKDAAYWARIAAVNLGSALLVTTVFSGVTLRTPWREVAASFGVALLFSTCIAPLLGVAMPRMAPWIWCRLRFPLNWAVLIATMIVLAVVGSTIAINVLTLIGYLPPGRFFEWLGSSLKVAIVVTLSVGLAITVYEMLRAQLQQTTLALRTKERDEAEARRLAAEAQLASLESRVQPHFLFNTLNSIAALVHDDPQGAERMTGQLAALLRSALDGTATPLVRLDEELRIVRAYLDIEAVRFGDRLRYAVQCGDEALAARVPRMALQTLVENCVKYAVSTRREGASIVLRATHTDDRLRLTVEDDGPGFDAEERPAGHGLALLEARLAMLFGEGAMLHVESRDGYSAVTVDVPYDGPAQPRKNQSEKAVSAS